MIKYKDVIMDCFMGLRGVSDTAARLWDEFQK
jgi:hypothetical protein